MRTSSTILLPIVLTALVGTGCSEEYTLPSEACSDKIVSPGNPSDAAISAGVRINCYRRFVGLPKMSASGQVSRAAGSHAQYLNEHWTPDTKLDEESEGQSSFTGEFAENRYETQNYQFPDGRNTYDIREIYDTKQEESDAPEAVVDTWMHNPLHRQWLLQPAIIDGGYGQSGVWTTHSIIYRFPPAERLTKPIIYPGDGQLAVPTTYSPELNVEPFNIDDEPLLFQSEDYGYPITITVGSSTGVRPDRVNPYNLTLISSDLTGLEGDVPLIRLTPNNTFEGELKATIALVPEVPLEPNSPYRLRATVSWSESGDTPKDIEIEFTTGS